MARTVPAGLLVPLYSYPESPPWDTIFQVKESNPQLPIVVIINPANGPGDSRDPNYVAAISRLQAVGIVVLGYVYANYATRAIESVEGDISSYKAWYGVNGIFIDEMTSVPGYESYFSGLTNFARSIGLVLVVGNPGTGVPDSYVGTVDCIVVYEGLGMPSLSTLNVRTTVSKKGFAFLAYGVSSIDSSRISSAANYVDYMYVTDVVPNPYASLPSYVTNLARDLLSDSPPPIVPVMLTITSKDLAGKPLSGLWTVIRFKGEVVDTGYTPLSFEGEVNAQYTVSVANYGHYIFDHWEDTTTNPVRNVRLEQMMTMTAYYHTGEETRKDPL